MLEKQWGECTSPIEMLKWILKHHGDIFSPRQRRLYICALARFALEGDSQEPLKEGIRASEEYADGLIRRDEFNRQRRILKKYTNQQETLLNRIQHEALYEGKKLFIPIVATRAETDINTLHMMVSAIQHCAGIRHKSYVLIERELSQMAGILRDILPYPSRRACFQSPDGCQWQGNPTPDILRLAEVAYGGEWEVMPVLGDALEEAGYPENAITHCHQPGHYKGCWVVDLLLGKR